MKLLEALAERLSKFFGRHPLLRAILAPPVYYFSKPDPPPAPDYKGAATAQGAANVETARTSSKLSNPSYKNPMGSRNIQYGYTYDQNGNLVPTGDQDTVAITDSLTPEGQSRFDQEQRIISNVGNVAEAGLDRVGNAMASPFSVGGVDEVQNKAEQALMARMNPQLERDREALRTQLINTGFRPGTEGYDQGMKRADEQANDARTQAIVSALGTRGQSLQEENFLRNIPLNELNALRTGSQVSMPQFQSFGGQNVQAPNVSGAAQQQGQWDQGLFNLGSQQAASNTSGIVGLAGAAAMAY